jgi:hypothetical protein
MNKQNRSPQVPQYTPEAWRDDDPSADDLPGSPSALNPSVREQCRLLDLLGRINYKILSGKRVYVEVDGVVYKTLYGGYWRSVFTGIEHYLLRCEKVSGNAWAIEIQGEIQGEIEGEIQGEGSGSVDLPIAYSKEGWTARGHSLLFILNRDFA